MAATPCEKTWRALTLSSRSTSRPPGRPDTAKKKYCSGHPVALTTQTNAWRAGARRSRMVWAGRAVLAALKGSAAAGVGLGAGAPAAQRAAGLALSRGLAAEAALRLKPSAGGAGPARGRPLLRVRARTSPCPPPASPRTPAPAPPRGR